MHEGVGASPERQQSRINEPAKPGPIYDFRRWPPSMIPENDISLLYESSIVVGTSYIVWMASKNLQKGICSIMFNSK